MKLSRLILVILVLSAIIISQPVQAQSPVSLTEAVENNQVQVTINGRASSYYQPMLVLELQRTGQEIVDITIPRGLILQKTKSEFCEVTVLNSDPPSIRLDNNNEQFVHLYSYCLEVVDGQDIQFPSTEAAYLPTNKQVDPNVAKVLENIDAATDQEKESFAAQIAIWRANTGRSLSELQQDTQMNFAYHEPVVNKYLGLQPSPPSVVPPTPTPIPTIMPEPTVDNNFENENPSEIPWVTYGGLLILVLFVLTIILWIFKSPFKPGSDYGSKPGGNTKPDPNQPPGGPTYEPPKGEAKSSVEDHENTGPIPSSGQDSKTKHNQAPPDYVEHPETAPIENPYNYQAPTTSKIEKLENRLVLKVINGNLSRKEFQLQGLSAIISRGQIGQISLSQDNKISSPQAAIALYKKTRGKPDRIRDLGSRNGTYLNGQKLEPNVWEELHDQAKIKFGETILRYDLRSQQLVYDNNHSKKLSLEGNNRWLITRNQIEVVNFDARDTSISIPHLYIRAYRGLEIRNVSSNNKSYLQGKPIEGREALFNQDIIQIGDANIELQIETNIINLPETVGDYQREKLIATGGMAQVYQVKRLSTGESRALKIPRPEKYRLVDQLGEQYRELFEAEKDLSRNIQHDNIVRVFENGVLENYGNLPYLVMEYIDGVSVKMLLDKLERVAEKDVVEIVCQICLALNYLHNQHKISHCDIKPGNILISREGQVYLTDLGVAVPHGKPFSGMGVQKYLPQEIIDKKEVAADTDIYSLGQTMFEMLTNNVPGEASLSNSNVAIPSEATASWDSEKKSITSEIRELRLAAPNIAKIILKATKDRPERYQKVDTFLNDLKPHRQGADLKALVKQVRR